METKKIRPLWQKISIFVLLMSSLLCLYYVAQNKISQIFILSDDLYTWMFQVDSIDTSDEKTIIEGWAFDISQDAMYKNFDVILYSEEDADGYFADITYFDRDDVNNYFQSDYDYTKCGFKAMIYAKDLDIKNRTYEILIKPKGTKNAFKTGNYVINGTISFTHPNKFMPLDVTGTDLENLVDEGVCLAYNSDVNLHVYQYKKELYWITSEDNELIADDSFIQVELNSTRPELIVGDKDTTWISLGFLFGQNKLASSNTGRYKVAKLSIEDYPALTRIATGKYEGGWVWLSNLRLRYEVSNEELSYK